jgi:predicted PurR-regulated permease PerM
MASFTRPDACRGRLHKKVQDIREILQGSGTVGRFMAMLVALGQDFTANVEAAPEPLLVLGWIVLWDVIIGQIIEPLLFGDSVGVTPLALVLSAILWGTLWGPLGILLSTPLTICLLVLGRHAPQLRFLQVLLGHEPALTPYAVAVTTPPAVSVAAGS